jgi:hypothetical protein
MLKKKLNQFKQSVCYPKAMATSKIYRKRPALGENYPYFFRLFSDNSGKNYVDT